MQNINSAVQVAAGRETTCAVLADETAWCWGYGLKGNLGHGILTNSFIPVQVSGGTDVAQIAMGGNHSCMLLTNGRVKCWGKYATGNNENGKDYSTLTPVLVHRGQGDSTPLEEAVQIVAGLEHSCALISDGTVRCWGSTSWAALGDGSGDSNFLKNYPVKVTKEGGGYLDSVVSLSSRGGARFYCALTADGAVWCWGNNQWSQMGDGQHLTGYNTNSRNYRADRVRLSSDNTQLNDAVQVSIGRQHACAVRSSNRQAVCWGRNDSRQLGSLSTNEKYARAVSVRDGNTASGVMEGVLSLSAGENHTCALLDSGLIKCWGKEGRYNLGNGVWRDNSSHVNFPVTVRTGENLELSRFYRASTSLPFYEQGVTNSLNRLSPIKLALANTNPSPNKDVSTPQLSITGITSGQTVTVYSDASCTTPVGSPLTGDGSVTSGTLAEGTHFFYYSSSLGGAVSPCSPPALSYVYDTSVSTPTLTLQDVSTQGSPVIGVAGLKPNEQAQMFKDSVCTDAFDISPQATEGGNLSFQLTSLASGSHTFYAQVKDLAGNTSACTASPTHSVDVITPDTPGVAVDSSSGEDSTPSLTLSGLNNKAHVISVYSDSTCTTLVAGPLAVPSGETTMNVEIPKSSRLTTSGNYEFYVRATGVHHDDSSCSSTSGVYAYTLDNTPPADPTISVDATGNNAWPSVNVGNLSVGDFASVYSDSTCSTLVAGPHPVTSAGTMEVKIHTPLVANGSYWYYARSTDIEDNNSSCVKASTAYQFTQAFRSTSHYAIEEGYYHQCAIDPDRSMSCWGGNPSVGMSWELGVGDNRTRTYPSPVNSIDRAHPAGHGRGDLLCPPGRWRN